MQRIMALLLVLFFSVYSSCAGIAETKATNGKDKHIANDSQSVYDLFFAAFSVESGHSRDEFFSWLAKDGINYAGKSTANETMTIQFSDNLFLELAGDPIMDASILLTSEENTLSLSFYTDIDSEDDITELLNREIPVRETTAKALLEEIYEQWPGTTEHFAQEKTDFEEVFTTLLSLSKLQAGMEYNECLSFLASSLFWNRVSAKDDSIGVLNDWGDMSIWASLYFRDDRLSLTALTLFFMSRDDNHVVFDERTNSFIAPGIIVRMP